MEAKTYRSKTTSNNVLTPNGDARKCPKKEKNSFRDIIQLAKSSSYLALNALDVKN